MGADRYVVCPRCQNRHDRQVVSNAAKLAESYGKLPLPKFDEMRSKFDQFAEGGVEQTLREDCEVVPPVDDGELQISYAATCGDCGLTARIKLVKPLWTEDELAS